MPRNDKALDKAIYAIVDDIEAERYNSADEFRADVAMVSKGHNVSYGKVISLVEAALKAVNCE
jgi:hypothetical protein